jgi:hypothetical protein
MRRRILAAVATTVAVAATLIATAGAASATDTKPTTESVIESHYTAKIPSQRQKATFRKAKPGSDTVEEIDCYFTMDGSVTGTGIGPAPSGPYTLQRVDASWSVGIDCYGNPIWQLLTESQLTQNAAVKAYSVTDHCTDNCLTVLSPGGWLCTDGVGCAGNYQITTSDLLIQYLGGRWATYPDSCVVDNVNYPEQLICSRNSYVIPIPPTWVG